MIRFSLPPAVALALWGGSASAHIELLEPPARYDTARSGDNKACPCGDGMSGTCSIPGERSDDNRSTRVTELTAGQMLTLRFDEYVGHSGRYRVAFDEDGADLDDFNAHPLEDIADPPGKVGNTGEGSIWEIQVVVPDTPCNNCTLQLIQMMDGNMEDPVLDPVGRSSYYACADITISAADGADGETVAGDNEDGSYGEMVAAVSAADESGCSLGHRSRSASLSAALLVATGLLAALRRRTPALG
jgi:hypothetical protein